MPNFKPEMLANWTGGIWRCQALASDWETRGFCQDSRRIQKGDTFVALKTEQQDGHLYLKNALDSGAVGAVVEREIESVGLPQLQVEDSLAAFQTIARKHRGGFSGEVVGITGSCGKTSTKDLIAALLGDRVHKTQGNFNNFIGVPLTLTGLDSEKHRFGVVEAGINMPGEMEVLADMIHPDVAVVTTVAAAHLERLGSLETIAQEKAKIVKEGTEAVFFPGDLLRYDAFQAFDERAWILLKKGDEASAPTFKGNFVYYNVETEDTKSCRLNLESAAIGFCENGYVVETRSPGMQSNLCLAIAVARFLGVDDEKIQSVLDSWEPSGMRGQWLEAALGPVRYYVDCYNANPASMVDAFHAFYGSVDSDSESYFILGGMEELGLRSRELHYETGTQMKLRSQDRALIIGRNSTAFCDGMIAAGNTAKQVRIVASIEEIREVLAGFSGVVFLKGSRSNALERVLPQFGKEAPC